MSNALRALAQKAKNRLKAISSNDGKQEEKVVVSHKTYGEACLAARIQYAIIASQKRVQDDPLYNKIKRILIKNVDVINPLSQIIEHNIYDSLNEVQKEKYMCKLSKRYSAIKEHILKELEQSNEQAK